MATHDYVLDNASGANFRSDLNNALAAIVSNNSSSSEPSTKYAYQWWADTNDGVLKIRNSANDGWVTLLQLDGTLTLEDGSNSAPALGFRDDLDTGIFSSAANTLDVSCGGTTRGSFSSSGLTVTGNVTATTFVGDVDANNGDFDGTLEADAITVGGTALNTVIAGVASTNVTVADESSDTTCFPLFVTAATGDLPPKSGSNLTFNSSNGTLTATAFSGDGSGLTGVGSTTINSNADNRVITGSGSANTLNAETNVVIDSSGRLGIGTTSPAREMELVNSSSSVQFSIVSANNQNAFLNLGDTDDDNIGGINYDNTNNRLGFRSNAADRAQLKSNGNFAIDDGDLEIGTSGHGISFSSTSDASGMTSELLDDYEEGTFNAGYHQSNDTQIGTADGRYTKIGNRVMISVFDFVGSSSLQDKDMSYITDLPYAARSEPNSVGTIVRYGGGNNQTIGTSEACYLAQNGSRIKFDDTFNTGTGNWTVSLVYEAA